MLCNAVQRSSLNNTSDLSFAAMTSTPLSLGQRASELTIGDAFGSDLTRVSCVNISHRRDAWVATIMCAQYLESVIDSIVVRDDEFAPVGIIGGFDILSYLRKNPSKNALYETSVSEIMFRDLFRIENKDSTLGGVIETWRRLGRAFAIVPNEYGDFSSLSARRMLEVGTRYNFDFTVDSISKKKAITFERDSNLGNILEVMFQNRTRKLLLEGTSTYLSDRLILASIAKLLNSQKDIDNFFEIPVDQLDLETVESVQPETSFSELCYIMNSMEHPYVKCGDAIITSWDVCTALLTASFTEHTPWVEEESPTEPEDSYIT